MYKKTLIANYTSRYQTEFGRNNTLYSKVVNSDLFGHYISTTEDKCNSNKNATIPLYFFGTKCPGMSGSLVCNNEEDLRLKLHEYIRDDCFLTSEGMKGSLVVPRNYVSYQHFCLDFDLKHENVDCDNVEFLNNNEYTHYIETRLNTPEWFYMQRPHDEPKNNIKCNPNMFVYELIHILTNKLGLTWVPIYILGKAGSIAKGFHLEIPSLIMTYHDLAVLYEFLQMTIQNKHLLDSTQNYSAFGSCKYDHNNQPYSKECEFEKTYLPYCVYENGDFISETPRFKSLSEVFDTFNIFKPILPNTKIYALNLTTLSSPTSLEENNDIMTILKLYEEEFEYLNTDKSMLKNKPSESSPIWQIVSNNLREKYTEIQNLKNREGELPANRLDSTYIRCVGSLSTCNSSSIVMLYKNLKMEGDTGVNFADIPPFLPEVWLPLQGNVTTDSYILTVYTLPSYKNIQVLEKSFTNAFIDSQILIKQKNRECENTKSKDPSFLGNDQLIYPYNTKHVLKLCSTDDKRLRNTIFYLVCVYLLSKTKRNNSEYLNGLCDWLLSLLPRENNLLENFLKIYFHLKSKICLLKLNHLHNTWSILCIKHLLIVENAMELDEALHTMKVHGKRPANDQIDELVMNFFFKPEIFHIQTATGNVKIPHIICTAMLFTTTESLLYELLAWYRPILPYNGKSGSNSNIHKLILWDGSQWQLYSSTTYLKNNISLYIPEIYYISNIYTHIRNYRTELEDNGESNNKARLQSIPATMNNKESHLVNIKEQYQSTYFHCKLTRNSNIILTQIVSKIQSFWSRITVCMAPPIILKISNLYIILGICDSNGERLFDIKPIPIYQTDDGCTTVNHDNSLPNNIPTYNNNDGSYTAEENCKEGEENWVKMENLLQHIKVCNFLRRQLFPLCNQILKQMTLSYDKETQECVSISHTERKKINERSKGVNIPQNCAEKIYQEIFHGLGKRGANIQCSNEDENDKTIMAERRKLSNISRCEHHLRLTEKLCQNEDTIELIKLVKYFVLKQMSNCYTDMYNLSQQIKDDNELWDTVNEYAKQGEDQRKANENRRIELLAKSLNRILEFHPYGARLPPDIPPEAMTETLCECPITHIFICLLQIFSYDIASLRYILGLFIKAISNDVTLKMKPLHFFLGETNSAKTTFLHLILSVLAPMGGILSSHTMHHNFTLDRYHDLSRSVRSARFWYMDEISSKAFNRQLLNQITGNSRLFIRSNYESGKNVQLAPTILIFGNQKPTFNENCPALIERLRFFTFRSKFDSKIPTNFKMSHFPQLAAYCKNENIRKFGMMALILHATSQVDDKESPFYLYEEANKDMKITQNMKESTDMYSPISDIVKSIIEACELVDDDEYLIPHKRIVYLIDNLNILKHINVASVSDAVRFLGDRYHVSLIDNEKLACDNTYKDLILKKTAVFHCLREKDASYNDERINRLKKRKFDEEDGLSKRAISKNDYGKAIRCYSLFFQQLINTLLNQHGKEGVIIKNNLKTFLNKETNCHAILINFFHYMLQNSLNGNKIPYISTTINNISLIIKIQSVKELLPHAQNLHTYLPPNFDVFISRSLEIAWRDLQIGAKSHTDFYDYVLLFSIIIDNYNKNNNFYGGDNVFWMQELKLIFALYKYILYLVENTHEKLKIDNYQSNEYIKELKRIINDNDNTLKQQEYKQQQQLYAKEEEIRKVKEICESLRMRQEMFSAEQQDRIQNLESALGQKEQILENLSQRENPSNCELESMNGNESDTTMEKMQKLMTTSGNYQKLYLGLQRKIQEVSTNYTELSEKYNTEHTELVNIKQHLDSINKDEQNRDALLNELSICKQQLSTQQETLSGLSTRYEHLDEEYILKVSELEAIKLRLLDCESQRKDEKRQLNELLEYENLYKHLLEELANVKIEFENSQKKLMDCESKKIIQDGVVEGMQVELSEFKSNESKLKQNLQSITREFDILKEKLAIKIDLETNYEHLRETVEKLMRKNETLEKQNQHLQMLVTELETKLTYTNANQIDSNTEKLIHETVRLKSILNEKEKAITIISEDYSRVRDKTNEQNKQIEELKGEIERNYQEAAFSLKTRDEYILKLKTSEQKCNQMSSKLKILDVTYPDIVAELIQMKNKYKKLKDKLLKTQRSNSNFTKNLKQKNRKLNIQLKTCLDNAKSEFNKTHEEEYYFGDIKMTSDLLQFSKPTVQFPTINNENEELHCIPPTNPPIHEKRQQLSNDNEEQPNDVSEELHCTSPINSLVCGKRRRLSDTSDDDEEQPSKVNRPSETKITLQSTTTQLTKTDVEREQPGKLKRTKEMSIQANNRSDDDMVGERPRKLKRPHGMREDGEIIAKLDKTNASDINIQTSGEISTPMNVHEDRKIDTQTNEEVMTKETSNIIVGQIEEIQTERPDEIITRPREPNNNGNSKRIDDKLKGVKTIYKIVSNWNNENDIDDEENNIATIEAKIFKMLLELRKNREMEQ